MRFRGQIFGWYDDKKGEFRLSRYAADAPVRPSISIETKADAEEIARRKRLQIIWWPPLPSRFEAKNENLLD